MRFSNADDPSSSQVLHRGLVLAAAAYVLLLVAFWHIARHSSVEIHFRGHMVSTFASFALLLAPYWFFGFGAAELLRRVLTNRAIRALIPGLLVVPYLVYCLPRKEFHLIYLAALSGLPVAMAAMFEFLPPGGARPVSTKLSWQDVVALALIGLPVEFGWVRGSFPHPGLSAVPKLLLVDAALYSFLVIRRLDGVGYDFRPRLRDGMIGLRECAFFAVMAIGLGIAIGFIRPHLAMPPLSVISAALLITSLLVAIPEELFFRGLLQNLLESRLGHPRSLLLVAMIFGLSHFNKPLPFNWRYVLMGTIAGIFYGRAWRDRHRILASATTHSLVDVIWSFWFR